MGFVVNTAIRIGHQHRRAAERIVFLLTQQFTVAIRFQAAAADQIAITEPLVIFLPSGQCSSRTCARPATPAQIT